jgi:hypothetical protein
VAQPVERTNVSKQITAPHHFLYSGVFACKKLISF